MLNFREGRSAKGSLSNQLSMEQCTSIRMIQRVFQHTPDPQAVIYEVIPFIWGWKGSPLGMLRRYVGVLLEWCFDVFVHRLHSRRSTSRKWREIWLHLIFVATKSIEKKHSRPTWGPTAPRLKERTPSSFWLKHQGLKPFRARQMMRFYILHPGKLYPLKIDGWKMTFLFKMVPCVNFQGGI